ncbi:hypothetical protein LEN26_012359 [Aphanomyces euteiches]|nr:hypothetical protein LEN26_012359 [Aphanomyces euteiches]
MDRRQSPMVKKRKVTVVPAWTVLPTNVIIKIAFMIPGKCDLFTFLEALRAFNVLGPLEHLHKLGMKRKHDELWPSLRLTPAALESKLRPFYEGITSYYASVVIEDVLDVKWLRKHLYPSVQVKWIANKCPIPQEILNEWTNLRITRFSNSFYSEDTSKFSDILPRLPHLFGLKTWVKDTMDHLCPLIAKSTQLTELKISNITGDELEESSLLEMTHWLTHQPVRAFNFSGGFEWYDVSNSIRQKFYESMLNCPTMDELTLDARDAEELDFSKFEYSMRSLDVNYPESYFIQAMVGRLEGSKVTHLRIQGYVIREKVALKSMLEALPKTSIKYFRWDNVRVPRKSWCELAPLLEDCTVKTLALTFEKLHTDIAHHIAKALEKNKFICELDLTGTTVAVEDFQPLIESITHPSRPVEFKRIRWIRSVRRAVLAEPLAKLKQLAEERGGGFLF